MSGSGPADLPLRSSQAAQPASRYEAPYPFVRGSYHTWDEEGGYSIPTWKPGVRNELVPPDDAEAVADGVGAILIEEVSRHKPGRFPERVFFIRKWRDPDGKVFGNARCRVATAQAFNRLIKGYRYEFRLADYSASEDRTEQSEAPHETD